MNDIQKIAGIGIMSLLFPFLISNNIKKASRDNEGASVVYNINFNDIAARHQIIVPGGCRKNVEGKLVLKIPINTCKGAHNLYVYKSCGDEECDNAYLFFLTKVCKYWNSESFRPQKTKCEDHEFEYTVNFTK